MWLATGSLVGAVLALPAAAAPAASSTTSQAVSSSATASAALRELTADVGRPVTALTSAGTGALSAVRAMDGSALVDDDEAAAPAERAQAFLRRWGGLVGLDATQREALVVTTATSGDAEHQLVVTRVESDALGRTHVRLDQRSLGRPVFGSELVLHLSEQGVHGLDGAFVADAASAPAPVLDAGAATDVALKGLVGATAASPELVVYRTGLVADVPGSTRLAWSTVLEGADLHEQAFVDATTGAVLDRLPLDAHALDRVVYSPQYDPENPDTFVQRREGGQPSLLPQVNNLYDFAGQVHGFFSDAFGRDSYDGKGATMRSVYLVNEACPNAYWNGASTNYCPGFDLDDVVAHEWGHAYTEYTHKLVYACQPGALNESYSDIWGEVVDLLNGQDGVGGSVNDRPHPEGQRWEVGEDLTSAVQEALLRDMWDPERLGYPAKVSSASYHCGTSDAGGVHSNSAVPNHAFAMLVDGKAFNGQTVGAIGMTKAAHVYYRAMTVYQTRTSGFAEHAAALRASCTDLTGSPLDAGDFDGTGTVSITADDCAQVDKALLATEMDEEPTQCGFEPQLAQGAPDACSDASLVYAEDWETGTDGWTAGNGGPYDSPTPYHSWSTSSTLPDSRSGTAAFAVNAVTGTCAPGGDESGQYWFDSPPIDLPAGSPMLRFDHFMASEIGYDGGNVSVVVNGTPTLLRAEDYVFNGPTRQLRSAVLGGNTNPKAGQTAWTGADGGEVSGSWGTTIVELDRWAGQQVKLRFDFGVDGCNGLEGWYVDELFVYTCGGGSGLPPKTSTPEPTSPNLVVDEVRATPDGGNAYTLSAVVRNAGNATAGASSTRLIVDDEVVGTAATPALEPGGTASVQVTWKRRDNVGDRVLQATADSGAAVAESDEDDNTRGTTFSTRR